MSRLPILVFALITLLAAPAPAADLPALPSTSTWLSDQPFAAFDARGNEDALYTPTAVLKVDWSKSPGQEAYPAAPTLDDKRFPNDPRKVAHMGAAGRTTFGVRTVHDRRLLYAGDRGDVEVYRLDETKARVTAIPTAYVCSRELKAGPNWPPNKPPALTAAWVWQDANADGQFDAGEFQPFDAATAAKLTGPAFVDNGGAIWWFGSKAGDKAHVLPPRPDPDANGNPVYRPDDLTAVDMPPGYSAYGPAHFDDATGDLVLVAKPEGADDYSLARFKGWRDDPTTPAAWTVEHLGKHLRHEAKAPAEADVGAMTMEGGCVFVASALGHSVRIYNKSNGDPIGQLRTDLARDATLDNPRGLAARRLDSGAYVLLIPDPKNNKTLVYRWTPK